MQASQKCNPLYLWAEDIFPNDEGIMTCHKEWLAIGASLHALSYQRTEIIHLSVAKKWDIILKIETRQPYHTNS